MAKNREPVKPLGPESDHSEEEEEDDDSEESEPQSTLAKKPLKSVPQPQVSSSKPIASKPMDDPQKPGKKPQSKTVVSEPATGSKSTGKLPTEEKEDAVWSEEDEVDEEVEHAILTGMLDCIAKKKSNPLADPDALLDYMNKNLSIELSKNQLQEKIRRLEKFETSKSKRRKLLKPPREVEMFLLSGNIWGKNEKGKETVAASPKANGSVESKWGKNEKGRRFWP